MVTIGINLTTKLDKGEGTTGGLAIWRGDEYMLNFLFANRLQFQPTSNTEQKNKQGTFNL
jgi:hypothetical protein